MEDVQFTREDEHRFHALQKKLEEQHQLDPEEEMEFAQLKHRNNLFIMEGEQRLLQGAAERQKMIQSEGTQEGGSYTDSLVKAGKAAYFWGTLMATAVPGYLGQKSGVTPSFLHWNFIYDYLILGALPVVTQVGSSGNHLTLLKSQAAERGKEIGMVCACLEKDEIFGYGMGMVQFADISAWRQFVNPNIEYAHLPMVDTTANIPFYLVAQAVEKMNVVVNQRKQTCYVHCKAGKGRSWMVTMCFLTTYCGLSYDDAARLLKTRRGQVSPSSSQRRFASAFPVNFATWQSIKEYSPIEANKYEPDFSLVQVPDLDYDDTVTPNLSPGEVAVNVGTQQQYTAPPNLYEAREQNTVTPSPAPVVATTTSTTASTPQGTSQPPVILSGRVVSGSASVKGTVIQ